MMHYLDVANQYFDLSYDSFGVVAYYHCFEKIHVGACLHQSFYQNYEKLNLRTVVESLNDCYSLIVVANYFADFEYQTDNLVEFVQVDQSFASL